MKNKILLIVTVILLTSCASKSSFTSFYVENKESSNFSISTPAFFANLFIPKDDVKEYEDLFKKVRHYKLMIFSKGSMSLDKKFDRFIKQKNYISIFRINQNGDKVQFYLLKNKNRIREIVMKIKNDGSLTLLGLKTNILERDFNSATEKSIVKVAGS